jgi:hypothetical protein
VVGAAQVVVYGLREIFVVGLADGDEQGFHCAMRLSDKITEKNWHTLRLF